MKLALKDKGGVSVLFFKKAYETYTVAKAWYSLFLCAIELDCCPKTNALAGI